MGHLAALCAVLFSVLPGEENYRSGKQSESQGRYDDAIGAYRACAEHRGPLEPYALLRIAVCQNLAGDSDGAVDALTKLTRESPEGPWVPLAEFELGRAYREIGRYEIAAVHFEMAQTSPVNLWWHDDIRWTAAENLLEIPAAREKALTLFRSAVKTSPWAEKRYKASKILADSGEVSDSLLAASGFLSGGALDEAKSVLEGISESVSANEDWSAEWRYANARLFLARGDTVGGVATLENLAAEFPRKPLARKALGRLISEHLRQKDFVTAEMTLARLEELGPRSSETLSAHNALARARVREERPEKALQHYRRIAELAPQGNTQRIALMRQGKAHRKSGKRFEAFVIFQRIIQRYPRSDSAAEAAFWSGEMFLETGAEEEALEQYRLATIHGVTRYYGYRAQEMLARLGDPEAASVPGIRVGREGAFMRPLAIDRTAHADALPSPADDRRFQRLRFFSDEGYEEAEWEAMHLGRELHTGEARAEVYLAIGRTGAAYTAMQFANAHAFGENADGSQTPNRLRVRYPLAYWDTIQATGRQVGLDPFLLLSIARQESTFRPGLTSHAGAVGVMQLMPRTAAWIAESDPRLAYTQDSALKRPQTSIRLGAQYIRQMLDRYDGNLVYALAAYNGGPGNCDKWRKNFAGADLAEFVESIPFSETQNYVKRVLAHYATYHSLYAPAAQTG